VKKLLVVWFIGLAAPSLAFGQAQAAQPPKPGPEAQKLAYYVGMWQTEGEITAGPLRDAFKFSETGTCEWFAGGFHLVCRHEGTRPAGKVTDLSIVAYDATAKGYTYFTISSLGDTARVTGSLKGNTWTFLWDGKVAGKPARFRYTEVQMSPTSYTFKTERSVAGGPWRVLEEGKATKVE
jgi:Protein of unknown function (DUF1579)